MAYEEAITIGFSLITFCIFYLSTKFSGSIKILGKKPMEIEIFQPMFLVLGLLFLAFNIEIMVLLADANTQPVIAGLLRVCYGAIMWPVIPLILLYFVISFVYNLFSSFKRYQK